jgi:hypothetical protein
MGRDEVEAAYFAFLRAEEEVRDLRAYHEVVVEEARRLRRWRSEGEALLEQAPPKMRKRLAHSEEPLLDAIRARAEFLDDERRRLPERIAAAEAFAEESRTEHRRLEQGS